MSDPSHAAPPGWIVTDSGAGEAIVFVHGLGTDSSAWDRVVATLAGDYRVVTVDLPGYSLRSVVDRVPDASELADGLDIVLAGLGIDSAVLVGHSFGGAVSLITAHGHPQRCGGLVLVAPGGFGAELNPFIPLIGTRVGKRLLRSLYGPRTSRTIERIAARVDGRAGQDSRVRIAELMETYDRLRSEDARAQFRTSVQHSLALNANPERRQFTQIDPSIPILILWGRDDRVLPAWHAKNAAAMLPWSVVHLIDGAGHTPHRSHAGQTAREIRAFADSRDVRSRVSPAGS
ncbi:MAG TPA: alpha/beta fold hydrolase [Jatrophihabitantaceae bacterium]|jgi:pimeloyl-ACP methyl ester carboxylesterase|nr:alpha/beta fold hydrolase [Jatrophihabitantaceae bacterium]